MTDRWTNGIFEVIVPLDVDPDAAGDVKQDAMEPYIDKLMEVIPDDWDHILCGHAENSVAVDDCGQCGELRHLTRQGKARTFGISLTGCFQMVPADKERFERALGELLHCFTGGWTITQLPDDEQIEYEEES